MSMQFYLTLLLATNCVLVICFLMYKQNPVTQTTHSLIKKKSKLRDTPELEFIPKHPVISCNDLFTDSPINTFNLSTNFYLHYKEFYFEVNASVGGKTGPVAGYFDGHSMLLPEQYKALHYMASLRFVRTICETGFNYGHSSFNFLTANNMAVVHSFDTGGHHYTKHMADYLYAKFPGRFFIHYGDSTKTLPEFVQNHPNIRCDLMFVDGSHTYPVEKSDLENLHRVAGTENIIVMDDYPTHNQVEYGKAWEELVSQGKIKEIMRCKFQEIVYKHTPEAAFVLGSVVNVSP